MKQILTEWKKFLVKDENESYFLSNRQLESIFKVFHLSSERLGGETFEFTPRVPKNPLQGEDDTTLRVSLAPNINRAIFSLDTITGEKQKTRSGANAIDEYYVYAGDFRNDPSDNIPTLKLNVYLKKCDRDLSYRWKDEDYPYAYNRVPGTGKERKWSNYFFQRSRIKQKYGVNDCSDLKDFQEYRNCLDYSEAKEKFYACVPDAAYSREEWALNPVTLHYIGMYDPDRRGVLVDETAMEYIQSKLRKGRIKPSIV